ncbi:MAG: hypothetical protein KAI61_05360, partial [Alphaproteobacteria bacterium]|nr:hypothetical protein [Alphaproteobacteria bacterium]
MVFAVLLTFLFPISSAHADKSTSPSTIPHEDLMKLGRDFLSGVGKSLGEADLFLAGAGKIKLAEHKSRTRLPDNEPLIFNAIVGKERVYLKHDIYAIKRGDRLMVSLGDFCSAADLAISVYAKAGKAEGWFIRENQRFFFDAKKSSVSIMGKT